MFAVPQHGLGLHEDFQPYFDDVAHRALVRMSSVAGTYATRLPPKILGFHQRITGIMSDIYLYTKI